MAEWLTADRRQAIQGLGLIVFTMLLSLGFIDKGQSDALAQLLAAVISCITALIAIKAYDKKQVGTWLASSLRITLYTLALAAGAVSVAFHFTSQERVSAILAVVSTVLTVAQQTIAIVNRPDEALEAS